MRMLDLFCGRWGWSKAFAKRGWECGGIDLVKPSVIPENCEWIGGDILKFSCIGHGVFCFGPFNDQLEADFICASPPCEQFSVWGMKHFHPNPPYPELGIKLFEHTRRICEESGVPYVMENVRAAQQFVGNAVHHCGPFYLWGNAVPPILHRGIVKGMTRKAMGFREFKGDPMWNSKNANLRVRRSQSAGLNSTIPPELANAVADYAERLLEQRKVVSSTA